MARVELEDALLRGHVALRRAQHALEVRHQAALGDHQAERRVGEARREAHLAHLFLELDAEARAQRVERRLALGGGGLGPALERHVRVARRRERHSVELADHRDGEGIDRIGEVEHLVAAGLQPLDVRARLDLPPRLAEHVVDRLLPLLHPRLRVGQRGQPLDRGALEAQERRDRVLLLGLHVERLLQDRAEARPERAVVLLALGGELLQCVEHLLDDLLLDRLGHPRVLEQLAAHVERQILGVDDAAHEAEPAREQLLGVVEDEDALHVEAHPVLGVGHPQGERRLLREEDHPRELLHTLDLEGPPRERLLPVAGQVVVELVRLLVVDLAARALPERASLVDLLEALDVAVAFFARGLELDRPAQVVGVALHQVAEAHRIGELTVLAPEVQDDGSAVLGALGGLDREAALALRDPLVRLGAAAGRAADDLDPIGDEEGAVEADAELADERERAGLALFGFLQLLGELAGAALGDGAEVVDELLAAHPDAGVPDGQRVRLAVGDEADGQLDPGRRELGLGHRAKAQLVERVGRVREQLAQEDLAVRVERLDDEPQHLLDLGLEAVLGLRIGGGLGGLGVGHGPRKLAMSPRVSSSVMRGS